MGFFKDFFAERILPHPQMLRHSLLQKQNNFARILHRRNAKRPQTLAIKGLRALLLAAPRGLEPPTHGLGNRRSIH